MLSRCQASTCLFMAEEYLPQFSLLPYTHFKGARLASMTNQLYSGTIFKCSGIPSPPRALTLSTLTPL